MVSINNLVSCQLGRLSQVPVAAMTPGLQVYALKIYVRAKNASCCFEVKISTANYDTKLHQQLNRRGQSWNVVLSCKLRLFLVLFEINAAMFDRLHRDQRESLAYVVKPETAASYSTSGMPMSRLVGSSGYTAW